MVTVKEIENFKDYGKCVSISNGTIEALVTIDLGPRIISFGYVGSQNFMSDIRSDYAPMTDDVYTRFCVRRNFPMLCYLPRIWYKHHQS